MAINSLQVNQSTPVCGLGTQTFNVVTAGLYTVAPNFTIPYQSAGGPGDSTTISGGSSLQIVVNLNGSAKLTLNAGSPYAPSMGGSVRILCAANDVITVVLSSSAAADNALNAVKGIVNLFQGE